MLQNQREHPKSWTEYVAMHPTLGSENLFLIRGANNLKENGR